MNSRSTIEDLLKEKNLTLSDEEKYSEIITAARGRKELLDRELVSGKAAVRDLSRSLISLGDALDRLAVQLEESTRKLSKWVNARPAPRRIECDTVMAIENCIPGNN